MTEPIRTAAWTRALAAGTLGALALLGAGAGRAQALADGALVKALQGGGYVLVMRHAASPAARPGAAEADPGNPGRERQLDAAGKASAAAMGEAIKALRLPIGEVWSSPTFRALQTARLAGLPSPRTAPELGDGGQSMQAAGAAQAAWLQGRAATAPKAGTDTVIVTHSPNITAAFGPAATGLADGEALVFHPGDQGQAEPVARIKIQDWPQLAAAARP